MYSYGDTFEYYTHSGSAMLASEKEFNDFLLFVFIFTKVFYVALAAAVVWTCCCLNFLLHTNIHDIVNGVAVVEGNIEKKRKYKEKLALGDTRIL